ncbi:hypothetical protein [Lactococcus allomyrinae]|uniref:DNA methyltransferase n=1 Tax=Lactococcus allomyrinae TaxID=2419773 RepID=A0A387BHF2_9LACT|nr:hypothetical protein [Lactococcus allomyrinae]AYG01694.1 hypothetical protein D7I46_11905 [Lactococcus allomyrinae]
MSDLTSFFATVKNLPQPDLIFANPPCETFSVATRGTFNSGNTGNLYYYEDGTPITDFEDWKSSTSTNIRNLKRDKGLYFENIKKIRDGHERLHMNTETIIRYFGVPFAIENPAQSICFKKFYQNSSELLELPYFYDAMTYYLAYDPDFLTKPTKIRASIPLVLRPKPIYDSKKRFEKIHNYNEKSAMPHNLIKSIVYQLLGID